MRPVQSSRRVTFSRRPSAVGSSITRWSPPSASSRSGRERARVAQQALRREHDQRPALLDQRLAAQQVEVLRRASRRSRRGCCPRRRASGSAPRGRSSARGPRPRSRAGRSSVSREVSPHFARPETMNWSIVTCAAFTKSPNCASHITSVSGAWIAVAVLEAERARLRQRAVVDLERGLGARAGAGSARRSLARLGVVQHQVALAERAARGVLAGQPQRRALHAAAYANASASAWPQSTGSSAPTSARFSRCGASLRWTLKSSGAREQLPVQLEQLVQRDSRSRAPRSAVRSSCSSPVAGPPSVVA